MDSKWIKLTDYDCKDPIYVRADAVCVIEPLGKEAECEGSLVSTYGGNAMVSEYTATVLDMIRSALEE